MKIIIEGKTGGAQLNTGDVRYSLPDYFSLVKLLLYENERALLKFNDIEVQMLNEGTCCFPIPLDRKGRCKMTLQYDNTADSFNLFYEGCSEIDEHAIRNLIDFTNGIKSALQTDADGETYQLSRLLKSIGDGSVPLLMKAKPLTGYDDTSLSARLSNGLNQKIRAICSSPKQGTMVEELIQEVSSVKRINNSTLVHLSSHTEHWKTRTLTGLIPKRLRADIIEDNISIYENLFYQANLSSF